MRAGRSRAAGAMTGTVAFAVAAVMAVSAPVSAQRAATAAALVQVPSVSELSVVAGSSLASDGAAGVLRMEVRTNHEWEVLMTAPAGAERVWVRVVGATGDAVFRRLEPGVEMAVAGGDRGGAVVDIEYRVDGGEGPSGIPLRYTLAAR